MGKEEEKNEEIEKRQVGKMSFKLLNFAIENQKLLQIKKTAKLNILHGGLLFRTTHGVLITITEYTM